MVALQFSTATVVKEQQNLHELNLELFSKSIKLWSPMSTEHLSKVSQSTQNKTVCRQSHLKPIQPASPTEAGDEISSIQRDFAFPTGREETSATFRKKGLQKPCGWLPSSYLTKVKPCQLHFEPQSAHSNAL